MKKIFLIFICSINSILLSGQANIYHPFPDSNCYWIEFSWWTDGCHHDDDHNLFINGDTTIGAYSYHKLYRNGWVYTLCPPNPQPPYYYSPYYIGGFRQDIPNKKIYLVSDGQEQLAYDFNLNVGDLACFPALGCGGTVLSIDSVQVGNSYNKRYWLSEGIVYLIEGIGSSYGAFAYLGLPFESGSTLGCVKVNSQTIWPKDTSWECNTISSVNENIVKPGYFLQPNPFSRSTTIHVGQGVNHGTLSIFNFLGQRVKTIDHISGPNLKLYRDLLPEGVYFVVLTQDNRIILSLKAIIKD